MTTEILRNMLYKGSEITRELAWVIFDEVHYMRDKERGVVWEETIILLPNFVKYAFLSATIPNAKEFAQWICKIKNQPCNVVYTDFRPVPLQHYVYTSGSEGIYLVVDDKGNFREENFTKALSHLSEDLNLDKIQEKKTKKKQSQENDIKKIITLIKDNELDPAIVFSFSKRDCESNALALSKLDLTSEEEKISIELIYKNAISTLSEEDAKLPQIEMMLPLLKKGIGVHHGGLLPIVKESVELIFQEGLLKVLFSTETFSMGINMPARTVVFTSIEKFDGEEYRWLGGGEYIQMSGRAGRRGIDDKGLTILMMNKKLDPDVCRGMLMGKADSLYSMFHLSYNMLVNLLRVEGVEPEYIIKRSFHQFQCESSVPAMKEKLKELHEKFISPEMNQNEENENILREILAYKIQIEKYKEDISKIIAKPENLVPFLAPGRLLKIRNWGWGAVVNFSKKTLEMVTKNAKDRAILNSFNNEKDFKNESGQVDKNVEMYFVDVILYCKNTLDNSSKILPGNLSQKDGIYGVVPCVMFSVENISPYKINLPHDLTEKNSLKTVESYMIELFKRFKNKIPEMCPLTQLMIKDENLKEKISKKKELEKIVEDLETKIPNFANEENKEKQIEAFKEKEKIRGNILQLCEKLSKSKDLVLREDLKNMKRVLRKLDCVEKENVIQKGQVACLISTSDEILLTEMLYNGSFNDIDPPFLSAFLSCFLAGENSKSENKTLKNPILAQLFKRVTESAEKMADVLIECKINLVKSDYIESFKPDLMETVLDWANGAKFIDICQNTDVYEGNFFTFFILILLLGTIIRCIRRIDELIRQLEEACQVIGNMALKQKFAEASKLIQRGIIFAASLYLNNE
jgi:ATP-dependent RNA helicase DOB1